MAPWKPLQFQISRTGGEQALGRSILENCNVEKRRGVAGDGSMHLVVYRRRSSWARHAMVIHRNFVAGVVAPHDAGPLECNCYDTMMIGVVVVVCGRVCGSLIWGIRTPNEG